MSTMREVYTAPERAAVERHLTYDIWPPVSVRTLPAAMRAIAYCREGKSDWHVDWAGVYIPARALVERLHLQRFVCYAEAATADA